MLRFCLCFLIQLAAGNNLAERFCPIQVSAVVYYGHAKVYRSSLCNFPKEMSARLFWPALVNMT